MFQPGVFAAVLEASRTSERMVGILEDMLALSLSLSMSLQQITETLDRLYEEKNNT